MGIDNTFVCYLAIRHFVQCGSMRLAYALLANTPRLGDVKANAQEVKSTLQRTSAALPHITEMTLLDSLLEFHVQLQYDCRL